MDKAKLLAPRLPQDDVEVPGVGTVRVRGLSRRETIAMREAFEGGIETTEFYLLTHGLVDPVLTAEEVEQWREAATAREITPVTDRILELSGLAEGSAKAAIKSTGE